MLPSCGVLYFPYAIRVNFISISILTISPFDFPPLFILSSLLSPLKYSVFFTPIFSSVMCCFDELILFLSFSHHHIGLGSIHQLSNHSHHIPFHPIHQFASQLVSQSDSHSVSRLQCSVCYHLYDKPEPEHQIPYSHA